MVDTNDLNYKLSITSEHISASKKNTRELKMDVVGTIKDKVKRHKERHSALDFQYLFSDSIDFVNQQHWNEIAVNASVLMSINYLKAIECCSPENTTQRYAIAYQNHQAVAIVACQIADISGQNLASPEGNFKNTVAKQYRERLLVCGNLVSSGLHGVAFAAGFDQEMGWKIVAEILYKIRRSEKLNGKIDFTLIKDIKGQQIESSSIVERFSYRRIQTDPDMVLQLENDTNSFKDYLALLNSKYRSRVRKVIKSIDAAGFECKKINLDAQIDKRLHALYLNVEQQSKTRLATLPTGYFLELSKNLPEHFVCYGIFEGEAIVGFISMIKDRNEAIAYYVGFDYKINDQHPIYFRLLQLAIQAAIDFGCSKVLFGRSALEPKANLGAKPVDAFVWARHRVPAVNFIVRKIFRNVPFDEAPERGALKEKK
jgi:GNAT acetyltransferase-like protein